MWWFQVINVLIILVLVFRTLLQMHAVITWIIAYFQWYSPLISLNIQFSEEPFFLFFYITREILYQVKRRPKASLSPEPSSDLSGY